MLRPALLAVAVTLLAAGARGSYCVSMWTQDRFNRLAGPANAWVTVP